VPVVVAFVSQKGGVGKTTLARALGAVAAHAGLNVLIGDLDYHQRTASRWEETRREHDIKPVLHVETFASVADALDAADGYELLILDAPGGANAATLDIARASHLVVQPTGPSIDDLFPGVLLFHELVGAGLPRERLALALCRFLTKDEEKAARHYIDASEYEALPGSIPERASYRVAHNQGRAVTEADDDLDKRADALIESLLVRIASALEQAAEPAQEKDKWSNRR